MPQVTEIVLNIGRTANYGLIRTARVKSVKIRSLRRIPASTRSDIATYRATVPLPSAAANPVIPIAPLRVPGQVCCRHRQHGSHLRHRSWSLLWFGTDQVL